MNLTRIQYFVEVARRENFSQAAKALYVSQPNLSKQIALMEQELGFDLFRRVGKSVHLTQAGQYLYEQFKDLPERTAQAIAHAHALSRGDMGNLSVGVLEGQDVNLSMSRALARTSMGMSPTASRTAFTTSSGNRIRFSKLPPNRSVRLLVRGDKNLPGMTPR